MKKHIHSMIAAGLFVLVASSCNSSGSHDELTGSATVALAQVPQDVKCVQVKVDGSRSVTQNFDVVPGSASVLSLSGLPLGRDSFSATAFAQPCASVRPDTIPAWVGQAVVATVAVQPAVTLSLVLQRNGRGVVTVDFQDDPDGGLAPELDASTSPDAAAGCPAGLIACGTTCVNAQADNTNCGACGNVCAAGLVCSNGSCNVSCQTGLTNCSGRCVNLATDNANCGRCGTACAAGQICSSGACTLTCQTGLTNCSGVCTNLASDSTNCGACGRVCAAGQICSSGTCVLTCQAGLTNCSGVCTNLATDSMNCGACGRTCATGKACSAGTCAP